MYVQPTHNQNPSAVKLTSKTSPHASVMRKSPSIVAKLKAKKGHVEI